MKVSFVYVIIWKRDIYCGVITSYRKKSNITIFEKCAELERAFIKENY